MDTHVLDMDKKPEYPRGDCTPKATNQAVVGHGANADEDAVPRHRPGASRRSGKGDIFMLSEVRFFYISAMKPMKGKH